MKKRLLINWKEFKSDMMRNPGQTIGNLIDKQKTAFVASIDGDTTYYAGGVTDPDYCVLRFTAQSGRYYSNFNSEDFEV